jgi:hypothetical protein
MSNDRCPRIEEIRNAVRRRVGDEDIARHLASCPECADEALVSAFFVEAQEDPEGERPLPEPVIIWRRAIRARRIEAAQRATRIITVWKWTAIVCGVALAFAGGIRYSAVAGDLLSGVHLPQNPLGSVSFSIGSGAAMMAIAGMLTALVLIDRLVLADE